MVLVTPEHEEGYEAFCDYKLKCENPYIHGNDVMKFLDWNKGYDEAKKDFEYEHPDRS